MSFKNAEQWWNSVKDSSLWVGSIKNIPWDGLWSSAKMGIEDVFNETRSPILKDAIEKGSKSTNSIIKDIANRVKKEKQMNPAHYSRMHHRHSRR